LFFAYIRYGDFSGIRSAVLFPFRGVLWIEDWSRGTDATAILVARTGSARGRAARRVGPAWPPAPMPQHGGTGHGSSAPKIPSNFQGIDLKF